MTRTVIVGAGAAGLTCAKQLRQLDETRAITVLDKDRDVPYERPPLSKALSGTGAVSGGTEELKGAGIDVVFGTALGANVRDRLLHTSGGDLSYDELVLAPGSRPHRPAWVSDEVHALHSLQDSRRLRQAVAAASSAVVVGGGFVGAELAASLVSAGVQTTFVFREDALFRNRLGEAASDLLNRLHTDAGVTLIPNGTVADVHAGQPAHIHLTDGTTLRADLVVAGIGSHPDTAWLSDSGLLADDATIRTDACLHTSASGVMAAGDSVSWIGFDGSVMRSAHWTTARSHGRHIAVDLAAGTRTPFLEPPYFWSMQHGSLLQGIGHVDPQISDIEVTAGSGPKPGLLARYLVDGELVGAVAINHPQGFMAARADVEQHAASTPIR
ncbi:MULTISPECIES: NAD(P)/FAD-dependent oxidoreductase [unclassified Microbacterium]|uniref:NAD(P)/FAD-dependent oxidoreductase n=1 Tax=unclassified Microbacterium TaxID=2609290 RepID=UPI0016001276|nr:MULTISPECIES: FAD/NAD(P)-binding oxidoreductase [unclassified Microbacterium]MBT2483561.1 NAD(P)/FAD-dependent oxidoreductase [Microbacterium sp. ISL-108]